MDREQKLSLDPSSVFPPHALISCPVTASDCLVMTSCMTLVCIIILQVLQIRCATSSPGWGGMAWSPREILVPTQESAGNDTDDDSIHMLKNRCSGRRWWTRYILPYKCVRRDSLHVSHCASGNEKASRMTFWGSILHRDGRKRMIKRHG